MESPKLEHLYVLECPRLELFQNAYPDGEGESSNTSIKRRHLFLGLQAISILEDLSLDWKHISLLQFGQHPEDLKYLNTILLCFDGNEEPTLPLEILEKAHNLQDMTLQLINSLHIFLTPNPKISEHGILGQLKTLTLHSVSELQCISLEDSWLNIVCEKLNELNVMKCPCLTKIFHSPSATSLSFLKNLYIIKCHRLEYLFTSSVAKLLVHLEKIVVKRSQSIKEIMAKDQDGTTSQGIKFERLYCIRLDFLSSLECFYSGNDTMQLPSLTKVDIIQCPKMEVFSQGEINAKSFQGIQASSDSYDDLVFCNNDLNASVEKVFLLQQVHRFFGDSPLMKAIWLKSKTIPDSCFGNLNSLVVEGCEFLSDSVLPSHLLPFLSNLKTLEVRNCNSVQEIFDYTNIGHQGSLGLPFLEKLCVENCKQLLEIVGMDETASKEANKEIIMFPRATCMRLLNLHKLRCIYPGGHIPEWPMLNELYVMHCPMLKFFATEVPSASDSHSKCQDSFPTKQPCVSLEKVTPCLEVLSLGKEEANMIEQGKLHVDLQELNSLILQCFHDESDLFPFVFCSKASLPCIKKLVVRHSAFKEIFPSQTSDTDCTKILSHLEELELRSLPLLKSTGLGHSWMGPFLENLETLLVLNCGGLANLTSSTVSFSNLTKLHVKNCHGLKYLFTFSTAKTLCALEELCVANCKSLKAIVAKEGDEYNYDNEDADESEGEDGDEDEDESETEDDNGDTSEDEAENENLDEDEGEDENVDEDESGGQDDDGDKSEDEVEREKEDESVDEDKGDDEDRVLFKQLKILKFSSLPKLGNFYSGSSTLKFPSLERMSFTECYNTKIFRLADELSKPSKELQVTIDGECLEIDVNYVIKQQFEERQHADLAS